MEEKKIIIDIISSRDDLIVKEFFYSIEDFKENAAEFIKNHFNDGSKIIITIGDYKYQITYSYISEVISDYKKYDKIIVDELYVINEYIIKDVGIDYCIKKFF